MKKIKGFTLVELIAVVAILGLIALVVYPAIASVIRNSRESAYNDQVAVIEKAAKTWSLKHANILPDDGSVYRLPVDTLVNEGYISNDEIKDPRHSSENLKGNVEIKYDSSKKQFIFTYVDKSEDEDIAMNDLATTIINNSKKKDVLLAQNGIYKGENPDNYLKLNGKLWRIISNNSDGSIKIISNDETTKIAWSLDGNINFDNSTVKTYLNNTFFTSLDTVSEFENTSFCTSYENEKCIEKENVNVGLLTTRDYLNASNNLKCINGTEVECTKGNYLSDFSIENGPEYTINNNGTNIYTIENGIIDTENSNASLNVRPVLTINKDAKIIGGTGSENNPYIINAVWKFI